MTANTTTVSYQPWPIGQTYQYWAIPLATDTESDDLTGVDLTKVTLYFRDQHGTLTVGTGTLTVASYYPAVLLYKPSARDVASAFNGTVVIKAMYPPSGTSADEVVYDGIPFVIS